MDPMQTLRDFALNLLANPGAMSAFESNPQAMLANAGLSDVMPADVHDLLPLVMDYAPSHLVDSGMLSSVSDNTLLHDATNSVGGVNNTGDLTHQLDSSLGNVNAGGLGDHLGTLGSTFGPNQLGALDNITNLVQANSATSVLHSVSAMTSNPVAVTDNPLNLQNTLHGISGSNLGDLTSSIDHSNFSGVSGVSGVTDALNTDHTLNGLGQNASIGNGAGHVDAGSIADHAVTAPVALGDVFSNNTMDFHGH